MDKKNSSTINVFNKFLREEFPYDTFKWSLEHLQFSYTVKVFRTVVAMRALYVDEFPFVKGSGRTPGMAFAHCIQNMMDLSDN